MAKKTILCTFVVGLLIVHSYAQENVQSPPYLKEYWYPYQLYPINPMPDRVISENPWVQPPCLGIACGSEVYRQWYANQNTGQYPYPGNFTDGGSVSPLMPIRPDIQGIVAPQSGLAIGNFVDKDTLNAILLNRLLALCGADWLKDYLTDEQAHKLTIEQQISQRETDIELISAWIKTRSDTVPLTSEKSEQLEKPK